MTEINVNGEMKELLFCSKDEIQQAYEDNLIRISQTAYTIDILIENQDYEDTIKHFEELLFTLEKIEMDLLAHGAEVKPKPEFFGKFE